MSDRDNAADSKAKMEYDDNSLIWAEKSKP